MSLGFLYIFKKQQQKPQTHTDLHTLMENSSKTLHTNAHTHTPGCIKKSMLSLNTS